MNNELIEWLDRNKITYHLIDEEVFEIPTFGKIYFEDVSELRSIFRTDAEGRLKFNSMENITALQEEGINYITFKFGDNWYYYDTRGEFKFNILKYIGNRKSCVHQRSFVNLGIHSPYELLNGSFPFSDWIRKAKHLGQNSLGICDLNTMAGTLNLQKECFANGFTPVFGYSLVFTDDAGEQVEAKMYAQSQNGLQNLLRIQAYINIYSSDKTIPYDTLINHSEGNVLVFGKLSAKWMYEHRMLVDKCYAKFDQTYYQLDVSEYKAERIDIKVLESTKLYFERMYGRCDIEPVLITDCYYLDKDDAKNKIILNKIATGAAHEQSEEQYYKDLDEHWDKLSSLFSESWNLDSIFQTACDNTLKIAEGAKCKFEIGRSFMPEYSLTPEEKERYGDRHTMFLKLLKEGFERLVPKGMEDKYRERLEHEIYVLESTNNVDYMLVQYDTVNWARQNGILVGCGRGSAGGCLVLYLLGITLIDPIKYNLIFERFLLPERAGLYQSSVTIVADDVLSSDYVAVTMDNNETYYIDKDAQLYVKRHNNEEPVSIYADELLPDDDILFDNRDLLFTLQEIQTKQNTIWN